MATTVAYANRDSVSCVTPCESSDCPPELARRIDQDLATVNLLARQGLWTQAGDLFRQLRETCLAHQPNTLDLFALHLSETTLGERYRLRLARLAIEYVGQLQHASARDLEEIGFGPQGLHAVRELARRYQIALREDRR